MKIIISGGHLTPALALIDFIKTEHPEDEIVFVGRIHSQDSLKQLAQEATEIKRRNIKFIPFNSPKKINFSLLKAVYSASLIFKQEQPELFLSFGGYLAIPLAIAAKLNKIRIVTHEQTQAAGFANQFIARLADKVATSYPTSRTYFPKIKTHLTGNPVRPGIIDASTTKPTWIKSNKLKPILLITGGSQGAAAINYTVKKILKELTAQWTVIHLCGNANQKDNYKQQLELEKSKLPLEYQAHYFIKEWSSTAEMAWIYDHTQLAVSRAGANTVMELTLKKIPTVFIPLPNSHHDEQLKNAQQLTKQNAALLLPQTQLSAETLLEKINELQKKHSQLTANLKKIELDENAVGNLYQLLLDLIHAK